MVRPQAGGIKFLIERDFELFRVLFIKLPLALDIFKHDDKGAYVY